MAIITAEGRPTHADREYWRGDESALRNAAKEAAISHLSQKLRDYAAFSYRMDTDGTIVCTVTVQLNLPDFEAGDQPAQSSAEK